MLHQIETGRYRRDKYRYERRQQAQSAEANDEAPEPKEEAKAAPSPRERREAKLDSLYSDFVQGRQRTGEPTHNLSREKLAQFIQTQEANIRQKYGDRQVDFKVVVEDGKTRLRAILKK